MPLAALTSTKKLLVGRLAGAVVQRPGPASLPLEASSADASPTPSLLARDGEHPTLDEARPARTRASERKTWRMGAVSRVGVAFAKAPHLGRNPGKAHPILAATPPGRAAFSPPGERSVHSLCTPGRMAGQLPQALPQRQEVPPVRMLPDHFPPKLALSHASPAGLHSQ